MTQQSDEYQNEVAPPEIDSEEDLPFDLNTDESNIDDKSSIHKPKDTSLSTEKSTGDLNFQRFSLGSATLGWCIFLMMVCIFISLWKPDNELVNNGFEAFKLIVMAILGYIFGSDNTKSG